MLNFSSPNVSELMLVQYNVGCSLLHRVVDEYAECCIGIK